MKFEELKIDNDYEIAVDVYPPIIRRKGKSKPVSIWNNGNGYQRITLNGKNYYVHRVIATQYIPNPDNLPEVDHINQRRDDNRIENLQWVTSSDNNKNKGSYNGVEAVYIDDLSEEAIEVNDYGDHVFDFLFFDHDKFYYYNGIACRELHINKRKVTGALYVNAIDMEGKHVCIYLNKFKRLYGLI